MNRKQVLGIGIALAAVAGLMLYAGFFRRAEKLEGSGTVEARNIRVGSKVSGRIDSVRVREGDVVQAGQILVTFEDKELLAAREQARANLEKMERGSRPEEIAEARAAAAQAQADYLQRRNGYRKEEVEAARADVERTRADAVRAERNFKRVGDLANAEVFSKQQRDDAEAAWKMAAAAQRNAEEKLAALERGYRLEEIASAEARYRQTQATLAKTVHGNRREDIEYARAQFLDADAKYRERQVTAPSAATVEVLDVRPGDLVAPNTPVATLLERDQIYVRIYIPETKIGRVHVGQRADLRVDSFPGQVFSGVVEQINQQAEFLPRNVQTQEERVHQVFGVKVRVEDPSGRIRPGMAAGVTLRPES